MHLFKDRRKYRHVFGALVSLSGLFFLFLSMPLHNAMSYSLSLSLSRRTPSQCNFFQFALAWHLHMPIFATTDDLECREYHTRIMHLCACSLYTKVAAHKNHLLLFSCRD